MHTALIELVESLHPPDEVGAQFLLTVTETVGAADARRTDVTLWYAVPADVGDPLEPDAWEFAGVRWWSREQLTAAGPGPFEPHLLRALDALGLC